MLRIDQIRLLPGDSEALLPGKCARILRLPAEDIVSCAVLRRAIDAREGLTLVYTAAVEVKREDTVLRRCRDRRVSRYAPETYAQPPGANSCFIRRKNKGMRSSRPMMPEPFISISTVS